MVRFEDKETLAQVVETNEEDHPQAHSDIIACLGVNLAEDLPD